MSEPEIVAGGGGRSSIGTSSLGGDGGDLSNSAIGASSGIGDTELLSIADNFIGDTLAILTAFTHPRNSGGTTRETRETSHTNTNAHSLTHNSITEVDPNMPSLPIGVAKFRDGLRSAGPESD